MFEADESIQLFVARNGPSATIMVSISRGASAMLGTSASRLPSLSNHFSTNIEREATTLGRYRLSLQLFPVPMG